MVRWSDTTDPNASGPVLCGKDPEQMGRVPPVDRVCATLHVQSIAARGIPNRLMLERETSYTPYLTQRLGLAAALTPS